MSISTIETASMMNDVCLNISQLSILFRILRHTIGDKLIEPESKITDLCGEMIVPQFEEYKHIHKISNKPDLILYYIRDSVTIFKKEISLLLKSNQLKVNEIFRIDVIIGGDHGQCDFRFPMKLYFNKRTSYT